MESLPQKEAESLAEDKLGKINEESIIKERKEKLLKFFKTNYNWITYLALAFIVYLAVKIRTRNLSGLKDVTTGAWTLGPDLDPFLFLRWAKYIVENGSLFVIDTMRFVPFGFNTSGELLLHPYMISWFHKVAVLFGSESVTQSAVIYPVFMFALTVIAFFLFARKIFLEKYGENKANLIGLISAIFLSIIPVFLPRTIAGIPEKESAAFLFLFLSFYFFISAWKAKKFKSQIVFALLSGASTAGMALIWGGYAFIFLTLAPSVFIIFLLGGVDKNKLYAYLAWLVSSFALMYPFSSRYSLQMLLPSMNTGPAVLVALIPIFHIFFYDKYVKKYFSSERFAKIPSPIISALIVLLSVLILLLIIKPAVITSNAQAIMVSLVSPGTSRIILTVAENKQPFLIEWWGSFGPMFKGFPILFWLFFIGSIYLFYKTFYILRLKERIYLTCAYLLFLLGVIFSRYSPSHVLNGINTTSLIFYALGFIVFIFMAGYYYYVYSKEGKFEKLRDIDISFVLLFIFFILCIIAARGGIRLILMLVPPISIIISGFVVLSFNDARSMKEGSIKLIVWILVGIIIFATLFASYQYYKDINSEAAVYVPSVYTQQWQKAMAWVRENTPQNAVFGHWWDYGYWVQSIGERATVLDGGNAQGYWNHMMGRFALTGASNQDALEFLYAHNTTHFLIDSTDIGKYTAFSSIGSDRNYDRRSWLVPFLRDNSQIKELKNSTIHAYTGGTYLDEDIILEENGTKIFLPEGSAGIVAVLLEKDSSGKLVNQPIGVYVYQNQQYRLPLRYAYLNDKFIDFGSGLEAGAYFFPRVTQTTLELDGAMIYLSNKTVKSQLARLYLYKEENPYFELVHTEDDFVVTQIKAQNPNINDIVYFEGIRGPIRIWKINYPADIEFKEKYLSTTYPKEIELA